MVGLKSKKWLVMVLTLAVVMAVGAGVAMAAGTAPAGTKGEIFQHFMSRLAANLGIDVPTLEQALKQAGMETVDEAVQQGVIPQDKADMIKQNIENGTWPGYGFCPGLDFGRRPGGKMPGWNPADLASILGINPADLVSELKSGKSLEDIAGEKGLTLDQVKEKLIARQKQLLDEKVAQGEITQEQADKILDWLQQIDLSRFGKFSGHMWKNRSAAPAPSIQ